MKMLLYFILLFNFTCNIINPKGDKIPLSALLFLGNIYTQKADLQVRIDGITINSGSIYSLPNTTLEETKKLSFVITNEGDKQLTIKSLSFKEGLPSVFISKYNSKVYLEPTESDSFEISYAPTTYGTQYGMLVLDTSDTRKSDFSITFTGSVDAPVAPTGTPTNITHTVNPDSSVDLFWDSASGASAYQVLRSSTSGSNYAIMGETTSLTYTIFGSDAGSTSYYKIKGRSSTGLYGNISSEHVVFIPSAFFPNATEPLNFNVSLYSISDTPVQILFLWDASTNADYYRIYWSNTFTISQNITNLIGQPITNSYVYTLTAADLGKTYYYQVYPYNSISSQGIPSSVQSLSIPLALSGYSSVTYDIPSSWSGVSYEYKNGYSGVQYQTWANYGYSSVTWETVTGNSIYGQGVNAFCSTGGCAEFTATNFACQDNPCSGGERTQVTVLACNGGFGGSRDIICYAPGSASNVYYSDIGNYSGNVSFATSGTWSGWGCSGTSGTVCSPGILSQAVVDGYSADPANYNVISATQIWTFTNPGTATLVQYSNFQAQQLVGNYRNLTGTQVWTSVGNQGTKTVAEYQTLQVQQFFGLIKNLTGTPVY